VANRKIVGDDLAAQRRRQRTKYVNEIRALVAETSVSEDGSALTLDDVDRLRVQPETVNLARCQVLALLLGRLGGYGTGPTIRADLT
jgi:hypothetical protein